MNFKTSLLFGLAAAVSLPAAAFTLGLDPATAAPSGPEVAGLLLIVLLAVGLRERDALDDPT